MSDFYGENCSRKCGYCLDGKICHHINGRCEQGCNPGYIDPFCTEGNHSDSIPYHQCKILWSLSLENVFYAWKNILNQIACHKVSAIKHKRTIKHSGLVIFGVFNLRRYVCSM